MGAMETQVEELPDNRVRLRVAVPSGDVKHAVDHATSDLAGSVRIPGFRKGKVPRPVLLARIGRERIYTEAVESHIGGWFLNAAATTRIRPVSNPEYDYDVPDSDDAPFEFTATVSVQPKPDVADWTQLEVPAAEPEIPQELIEQALDSLRSSVADLVDVDGRPARLGDVLVVDLVDAAGDAQRDYVPELGAARLVEEIEQALVGLAAGETKQVEYELADGSKRTVDATVNEIKEKVLPPLDDDFARAASEFDSLDELRDDIEARLREQLEEELETQFRAAAVDALAEASAVDPSGPLVDARAAELLRGFARSLERRGISPEAYLQLSGRTPEDLRDGLRAEAARAVARELVLEAVADKLQLDVSDEEIKELIREQAEAAGDDPDEVIEQVWSAGRQELLRGDLRLRKALDHIVADVKRIPVELARAREKLWTPEQEKRPTDTKLWTPGSKEPV
jgi:trigger factor